MTELNHGPKLSGEEYDKRIVALHENLPPSPTRNQERQVQRQELEIMIDHRLGTRFPKERREQLWQIQERIERKRKRLIGGYLLKSLFKTLFRNKAQRLAGFVVDEYAKVLSHPELEMFFGKEEVENPALPMDETMDQNGK